MVCKLISIYTVKRHILDIDSHHPIFSKSSYNYERNGSYIIYMDKYRE